MPRFNGTGPEGQGPLTGRGLGKCATTDQVQNNTVTPATVNTVNGQNVFGLGLRRGAVGRGCGIGRGRGCGNGNGRRGR